MANDIKNIPHIGTFLYDYVKQKRIRQTGWAAKQNISPRNISKFLKNPDMRCSTLFKICQALNYNFMYDIAAMLPPDMPCKNTPKDDEIAALKKENETLKMQVDLLKEVIAKK